IAVLPDPRRVPGEAEAEHEDRGPPHPDPARTHASLYADRRASRPLAERAETLGSEAGGGPGEQAQQALAARGLGDVALACGSAAEVIVGQLGAARELERERARDAVGGHGEDLVDQRARARAVAEAAGLRQLGE